MNEITDERKADTVRAQLEKICASTRFVNSHKLTQFLRLVVEESLAGRGSQIKEYSIGVEVYNRPSGYDPRVDATVRVEASKLRKRLSDYYAGEGQGDPILIKIPKGHYAPVFEPAAPENTQRRPAFPWRLILFAAGVVIVSAGTWWIISSGRPLRLGAQRLISTFPGLPYQRQFLAGRRHDRVHR
jgi:hypothetical protein